MRSLICALSVSGFFGLLSACTDTPDNVLDVCDGLNDTDGYICTMHHTMWLMKDEDCEDAHPRASSNPRINDSYQACLDLKSFSQRQVRVLQNTRATGELFAQMKRFADLGGGLGANTAERLRILYGEAGEIGGSGDDLGRMVGNSTMCTAYNRMIQEFDFYQIEHRDSFYDSREGRIRDSFVSMQSYACNGVLRSGPGPRRRL